MKLNEIVLTESIIGRIKGWLEDRRNRKIQAVWDAKSDEDIMVAYSDANDWLGLERPNGRFQLPETLKASLEMRVKEYIAPQMEKRGLEGW